MSRRGRPRGQSGSRDRILAAARSAFADHGYDRATIRRIAAEAGVDPALVHHYFGSKEDLFTAAVDVPSAPVAAIGSVFDRGTARAGEELARLFLTVWEDEPSREALLGQLRRGLVEGSVSPIFREFVQRMLLPRITAHLEDPDRDLRAELAAAQLIGVAILRYVGRIEPVASAPVERLVEMVAPRIQTYIDGSARSA